MLNLMFSQFHKATAVSPRTLYVTRRCFLVTISRYKSSLSRSKIYFKEQTLAYELVTLLVKWVANLLVIQCRCR